MKRNALLWTGVCMMFLVAACDTKDHAATDTDQSDLSDGSALSDESVDADTTPATIAEQTFEAFAPWSSPIEDFRSFGVDNMIEGFTQEVTDLAVFEERLWFGYGDANLNFGTKMLKYADGGIQFRYFDDPDNAVAKGDLVSGDEMIEHFRLFDGGLWYAGVDSTDPDELTSRPLIGGNFYRHDDDGWKKFRSVPGGEHVHDAAFFDGRIFTVGSGATDRTEWEAGNIFRYLWGSSDRGETFTVTHRIGHPTQGGAGDSRFVHLLPVGDTLYLFGYWSDFAQNQAYVANAYYDGETVTEFTAEDTSILKAIWPTATLPLPNDTGLVWGVNVDTPTLKYQIWQVAADGTVTALTAFAEKQVFDVGYYPETEELIYLVYDGDAYAELVDPVATTVYAAPLADPNDIKEIATHNDAVRIVSVAYWQGYLFAGTNDCRIFRANAE